LAFWLLASAVISSNARQREAVPAAAVALARR
jgi:hypothetical protein